MSFISGIKELFGNYFLRSEMSGRKRKGAFFNLSEAETIAIVFDATDPAEHELVKKYVNYLKEWRKKVKVIGFFRTKELPRMTYAKLEYDYFTLKEINWWHKPVSLYVKNFLAEESDVLIDLNVHDRFSLKYISAVSKAKFKIGKYSSFNKQVFDMLIQADKDKSLKFFLRQVDTYLQMINKKQVLE